MPVRRCQLFTDEGSQRLLKSLNNCFSVLSIAQRSNRYKSLSSNNQRRPGGCGVQIIIIVVVDIVFDDSVQLRQRSL